MNAFLPNQCATVLAEEVKFFATKNVNLFTNNAMASVWISFTIVQTVMEPVPIIWRIGVAMKHALMSILLVVVNVFQGKRAIDFVTIC